MTKTYKTAKVYKISISIISVFLIFAIVFGIITRNSYANLDGDKAVFNVDESVDISKEVMKDLNSQAVIKELEEADSVFVVTVKNSEKIFECTKTTVTVDRVIKGDESNLKSNVIIYEPNFNYSKKSKQQSYYFVNYLNNLMQENKQYLVFANKIEYSDSFQKTLDSYEYLVNIDWALYSFPIDNEIKCINSDKVEFYEDVKHYDYFCYSDNQKNILEKIRTDVFNRYLP